MEQADRNDATQGRLFEPRRPAERIDRRRFLPSRRQREVGLEHVRELRKVLADVDHAA